MRDIGAEETDEILAKMERKIAREYSQAHKEVVDKYNDYMRRFRLKDDIKRKAVETGKITKAEYIQWRQGQILMGKRWAAMVNELAEDLHNTNEIALSTARGYQPEVYAINHNWGAYLIEESAGIDLSYTLFSRETVERLIREEPQLLPDPSPRGETAKMLAENADLRWNRQKLASAITQGVLQGESIPNITKRLESVVQMDHRAAIRNARTMTTNAQNAGRIASGLWAKSKGVDSTNVWAATLDMRTRHEHRQLDGQRRDVGELFEVDGYKLEYPGDFSHGAPGHLIYSCRCTLIPQVKGFEYNIRSDDNLDLSALDAAGLTYEQWKKSHLEITNPITLPEEKARAIRQAYIAEYRKLRGK